MANGQLSIQFEDYAAQKGGAENVNGRRRYPVEGRPVENCRACRACIVFVRTTSGALMPVNLDGTTHFATCPAADAFRRRKKPL